MRAKATMLPNCKVGFKRDRKYYRGELVDGTIVKPKAYPHLYDIPKWDKYITIKHYNRLAKAKLDFDQLFKDLKIDAPTLYLLVEQVTRPTGRSRKRNAEPKTKTVTVYKKSKEVPPEITEDMNPRQWERAWFKVKNEVCRACTKTCKQSARVIVSYCPQYEAR